MRRDSGRSDVRDCRKVLQRRLPGTAFGRAGFDADRSCMALIHRGLADTLACGGLVSGYWPCYRCFAHAAILLVIGPCSIGPHQWLPPCSYTV